VQHGELQVGHRVLVRRIDDVAVAPDGAAVVAQQQQRHVVVLVRVAVPNRGAVEQHHVVDERAVAVRRAGQLGHELAEERHVVLVDLLHLLDLLAVAAVVRQRVVRVGDADLRIRRAALLAADHVGEDARGVGLVGEHEQVVHQPGVVLERDRDAGGRFQQRQFAVGLRFGDLDAPLDLAHGVEVVVQLALVLAGQPALQLRHLVHHRVEDAALLLRPGPPHAGVGAAGVAEQPLEHHAWVGLARHRRRLVVPRDVEIRATVAGVAGADAVERVGALQRQLQRRQAGLPPQHLGRELVHRGAQVELRPLGLLGVQAGQERRGGTRMRPERLAGPGEGGAVVQVREDGEMLAHRLHRPQEPRQLEAGGLGGRGPVALLRDDPVRHVDHAQPLGRVRRRLRQRRERRHHAVQERQRQRRAHAPQHRAARDGFLRDDHDPTLLN